MNLQYKTNSFIGHREKIKINVIGEQKQRVILGMSWLVYHNLEIDWRTGEVKIMRCSKECRKQQRSKQGKSGQQKQKEKEKREKKEKKQKKKRNKKERTIEIKKIVEKWKIWDKKKKAAKSEEEAKELVSQIFYQQIYVFGKKVSERMLIKKMQDYVIELKKGFVPRKKMIYPLSNEKRREIHKFIGKQLRKGYIRLLKLS